MIFSICLSHSSLSSFICWSVDGAKAFPSIISPDSFIKVKKLKVAKTAANTAKRKERRIREQRNRKGNEMERARAIEGRR